MTLPLVDRERTACRRPAAPCPARSTPTGLSIDTRTLAAGDLFVALVGDGRDGHAFVADAMAKGAAGAMVHRGRRRSARCCGSTTRWPR